MVCGDSDGGINGWAGQQAARLNVALTRNDYKHQECPTSSCVGLNNWWQDLLIQNNQAITPVMSNNVCVMDGTLYYVEADACYNTCVGFSDADNMQNIICEGGKYLCSGVNNLGSFTYGYPKQMMNTLARALEGDNYLHPQCPVEVC